MNIKKILKLAAISAGIYAISNVSFQCGKGFVLNCMKEYDLTVDETLDIVKNETKNGLLGERFNSKIIDFIANH